MWVNVHHFWLDCSDTGKNEAIIALKLKRKKYNSTKHQVSIKCVQRDYDSNIESVMIKLAQLKGF